MFKFGYSFLFLSALMSCSHEIVQEKGGMDIFSKVYFNASEGLDDMEIYPVSRLNYSGDTIIEIVPGLQHSQKNEQVYFIKDSLFYNLGILPAAMGFDFSTISIMEKQPVHIKTTGAVFTSLQLSGYSLRTNISDTILNGKKFKRFDVLSKNKEQFTRYYVYPTDTMLPYSMYKHIKKEYKGRIERIDTYDKTKDFFVTIQLIPRQKWDLEAKEIFEYNRFIKNKKK